MRALIIEPQVFASFMIEDALRDAGYTSIALARSEEEAMASAEASPPDLVTAALDLEPGSGLRAARAIRTKCRAAVLFITKRAGEVLREERDPVVIRKPFLAADLPPAIAAAQRKRLSLLPAS
jgi:DNA-binding response OmpR family regulator